MGATDTTTASPTIAQLWAEAVALVADLEPDDGPGDRPDSYRAEDWTHVFAIETAVLDGPIRSFADTIAKLKAVTLTFERGPRADHKDEPAMVDAIAWLEAHQ